MAKVAFKILIIITLLIPAALFSAESDVIISSNMDLGHNIFIRIEQPKDSIKQDKEGKEKPKKKRRAKHEVTFETFDENYARAIRYYDNQQFLSAANLFEELYPLSMGTPIADTVLFLFADCYFQNKDYEMAAFHFKDYSRRFPGTDRAELAHFKCVQAIVNASPYYSLDQSTTKYAIDEISLFIQLFPHTKYMDECNSMLDAMKEKLARKALEVMILYYNTGHYEAAQISANNFMKNYSYSKLIPEALYYLVKNNFEYAKKSVESKKEERYRACLDAYEKIRINYSDSEYLSETKSISENAQKELNKIKKQN